ncbi:IS6 family transposase (plasmid) [Deinococcus taeanensis]|uniref:IS6 family transposase n=1 Tax=Deinococcus taeanensis TaxID=2737050 RepID=UPI001CDCD839|nr:IS6 family transposase [Deinococcus taeanensis]UBV45478.1 IS6 family transposase [Deinococcus taeanensis]
MSGQKLSGDRLPLAVIGHAVWHSHRFTLSSRDIEELLLERGIAVTRESIRTWCITFSDLFAQGLRHREPRRGSRWHLDEMCVDVGGVQHWLWRAVDEHGAVLDVFLQTHRDTEAATSLFHRRLGEYDVPDVIRTDKLWSDGAALRQRPVLHTVEHIQVVSTARCNNIEQSHRPTRRQERQQCGFRSRRRAQGLLDRHARITTLHHSACSTSPARPRRSHQQAAFKSWRKMVQQVT